MTASSSNDQKYQSGNPVVKRLIQRFYQRVSERVLACAPDAVLDVGCGEGHDLRLLAHVLPARVTGCDLSPAAVEQARATHPRYRFDVASALDLPYEDEAFDLVLCLEVLEHLEHPHLALAELARVSREHVVVSTPWEPWFRLGNLARGKHVRALGNHPEHIQQLGPRSLARLVEECPGLHPVRVVPSLPWGIVHARVRH